MPAHASLAGPPSVPVRRVQRVAYRQAERYPRVTSVPATPSVTVFVPAPLRAYCGHVSELPVSAATVRQALDAIERLQPVLYRQVCDETGTVRRHLNLFVNDDNVRDLEGLRTRLKGGDMVTILPAVSGG
jgi:molybdopterin synthase sulfur carrier subunit